MSIMPARVLFHPIGFKYFRVNINANHTREKFRSSARVFAKSDEKEFAELSKFRFRDLRHTYASLLITQRENVKYIQNQLGHSSPTTTLDVYAQLIEPKNQDAACRLDEVIFGTGSKTVAKMKKRSTPSEPTP